MLRSRARTATVRQLSGGFTLVELLLAITLLGLIMVIAYGGLRSSARAVVRGEEMIERNNRLRVVQRFVRRQIANSLPLAMSASDELQDDLGLVLFEGDNQSMRFVAPMPGYLGHGGPHEQTISFERGELMFDHQLMNRDEDSELAAAIEERDPVVLLGDVTNVRFSYLQGAEDELDPEWIDEWEDSSQTPLMVRVEVEFEQDSRMYWPTLEVAPLIDVAATRSGQRRRPFRDNRSFDQPQDPDPERRTRRRSGQGERGEETRQRQRQDNGRDR